MRAMSGIVWFRVLIGAVWLGAGLEKLFISEFPKSFKGVLMDGGFIYASPDWFQAFMHAYVVPNCDLFAFLVGAGETAVGVGLILGLLTNLSATGGTFFGLTFLTALGGLGIGTGLGSPGILTFQLLMAFFSLVIILSPGAKAFSVDGLIAARAPRLAAFLLLGAGRTSETEDSDAEGSAAGQTFLSGMNGMTWVRVILGATWLNGGLEKLLNSDFPEMFQAVLSTGGYIELGPQWFEAVMYQYIVPNAEVVAISAGLGESAMGIGLILGVLTNFNAVGSIFMNSMLLISLGGLAIGTGLGASGLLPFHMMLALASLVVLLSPSAKVFSVDRRMLAGILARRKPRLAPLLLGIKALR